jgi:hypothetical protein
MQEAGNENAYKRRAGIFPTKIYLLFFPGPFLPVSERQPALFTRRQ